MIKKQRYKRYLDKLLEFVMRLRDKTEGSPWDQSQTLESIAPYTLEEAYEVIDAIERKDFRNLMEELGDLLYQVVYQSQIAKEMNLFDFGDILFYPVSGQPEHRNPIFFLSKFCWDCSNEHFSFFWNYLEPRAEVIVPLLV